MRACPPRKRNPAAEGQQARTGTGTRKRIPMNVSDRLTEHAAATPHGIAVIEGNRSTSFAALERAVRLAAASLRAQGVRQGEFVALAMRNGVLNLVAGYALARIGAVQLRLSHADGQPLAERLAARHRIAAILTDGDIPGLAQYRRLRADPRWLAPEAALGNAQADAALRAAGGEAPWMVLRTSGTTGMPKTILQTHAMYAARRELTRGAYGIERADRYFATIGLQFQLGFAMCLDALWVGATVILAADIRDAAELIETAKRHRATYTYMTPSLLNDLLPLLAPGAPRLPGLRVLRSGSMAMSEATRRVIVERLSPNLVISYGANDLDCGITEADPQAQARHPGSVGRPRPGVELEIVGEDARTVRHGQTGHVRVRVPVMPSGYFEDPAATARAFRDGWFHPGDLGMLGAAGELYLKGRSDDMMNCDGVKIYPADIEAALLEHPAVIEAVAFPLDSESRQHIPVAAVSLREPLQKGVLLAWCRERLGIRAPQRIVSLRKLPRGDSGKVLTREIAAILNRRRK
jgi:acyl-coenzyme A synthetase/AMP-(fatty) acid ligase